MDNGVTDYKKEWSAENYNLDDLDSHKLGRFEEFHSLLENMVGRFQFEEIEDKFRDETGRGLARNDYPKFFAYVDDRSEIKLRRTMNGIIIGTFRQRFEKHKERIDDQFEEVLEFCVGRGRSPHTIIATVEFLRTEKSMEKIATEHGITTTSVSDNKDFIKENKDEFEEQTIQELGI